MAKEIKKYKTTIADGKMTVRMLEKGADGKFHSASCEYPLIWQEQGADGKSVVVRKTKKQTENWLLSVLGFNA